MVVCVRAHVCTYVYVFVYVFVGVFLCMCVHVCVGGDPVVQPPSGDPRDLDSGHANGTTLVRRTSVPSCSLCPQWFTKAQASKSKEKRKTVSLFHAKRNC